MNMKSQFDNLEIETDEADEQMIDDIYVVIIVNDNKYAIPVKKVFEIVILPKTTTMPDSPAHVRGIINLRGNIISVIDTRIKFGIPTFDDMDNKFADMLAQRKQDHINWLNELIASIDENRPFRLTTDPHACAFGKWYDNYKPTSIALSSYLAKFDTPHKNIHALAEKVFKIKNESGVDKAKELITVVQKKELALMINLFDEVKSVLVEARREVVVIVNVNNNLYALTADSSDSVITIDPANIKKSNEINSKYSTGVYTDQENIIMMLNLEQLVSN